jgi:hypothetical protein
MSDQPPPSDCSAYLGWSPTPQLPFLSDEESFPAGLDPLNDDDSAFNGAWRSSATYVPFAETSFGDAGGPAPGGADDLPPGRDLPAPLSVSTPRSRSFAAASFTVEAAQQISSEQFDDEEERSWRESATPLPPLHAAGNKLRLALFPGYKQPPFLVHISAAEAASITRFENGTTALGATHTMQVEKMIVSATFTDLPPLADMKKGETGCTKELLFAEMQARHRDKFEFVAAKPKSSKDQRYMTATLVSSFDLSFFAKCLPLLTI